MRKLCLMTALLAVLIIPARFISAGEGDLRAPDPRRADARDSDRRLADSRASDVDQTVFRFVVHAVPQDGDAACANGGERILFRRTTSGSIGTIKWVLHADAANLQIDHCDGTHDGTADVIVDRERSVRVVIRMGSKKIDRLDSRCSDVIDARGDNLCLIDTETFNKEKSFTKIMSDVFDDAMEDVLWTVDPSTGLRTAQVWVLDKP